LFFLSLSYLDETSILQPKQQKQSFSRTNLSDSHLSLSLPAELFLPSYADYESQDLERKQDPVQDIVLTDEEIAAMFPQ